MDLALETRLARTAVASYEAPNEHLGFMALGWRHSDILRRNDGFTVFLLGDPDYLCVCFNGTDEPRDWLVNLDITMVPAWGGKVHRGFLASLAGRDDDDGPPASQAILDWITKYHEDRQIILIGHSLGGALATLCAPMLRNAGVSVSLVRTYGSPRVGDRKFAREYDRHFADRTLRYVNQTDPVPQIPWRWGRYRHVNRVRWSDGSRWRARILWLKWLATMLFARDRLFGDSFIDHRVKHYASAVEGLARPEIATKE